MKLLRAEFTNFRLLRDLIIDFSTDDERKLTVIRAENESGKTTILNALQWALYGDKALPGGSRQNYRLHPIDWDPSEGERVQIAVEIDYEVTTTRHSRSSGPIETTQTYRVIQSTYERVRGEMWEPGPTSVQLFEIGDSGAVPIEPPEALIREHLPNELREVFFTDGDRALSFIEADVSLSTKQARVRNAIQSLLGLDVIQDARDRVKKAASEVNRQAKAISTHGELTNTLERLSKLEDEASSLRGAITDAEEQFTNFDERYAEMGKKIEEALLLGNREELQQQYSQTENHIRTVNTQQEDVRKRHSELFRTLELSRDMMAPILAKGFAKLDELRDQGKIPNATIPVLEERLSASTCICGESLQEEEPGSVRRKHHIQHLIEKSRRADALQGIITDLYFGSVSLLPTQTTQQVTWCGLSADVATQRDQLDRLREDLGKQSRAIDSKLKQIPNSDVPGLRDARRQYQEQRDRANATRSRLQGDLSNLLREIEQLSRNRDQILRRQGRGQRFMADLEVAQDIETVLSKAYDRLTTEELDKVSSRMNAIFLEMIGADPQQGAIIRGAMITRDFEIKVYGPSDRTLNPDRDLNGASRRALTLAFILALTKVSEVQAPNVIDTPLGMMSGYVKRSVLTTAIRESSQLILFLTRSEITDCEEILDAEAGLVVTLTNPAHYPVMLANDPGVTERTILKCECDHRRHCDQCRRLAAGT